MEAVGQLTGGIAHDFNNILTVITGTIGILEDAVVNEPQLAIITRMIDEAAARGAQLTRHLLAFARQQPLQPQETDVNRLIIDTARLLRPTLGARIEIDSVFAEEACFATVDPNQLVTAILNLALNARDAMPDGGKLVIETSTAVLEEGLGGVDGDVLSGSYVRIAVSDTGSGIPAVIRDKVFDPFFTSKGPGKGSGRASSSNPQATSGSIARRAAGQPSPCTCRRVLACRPTWGRPSNQTFGVGMKQFVVEDNKLVRDCVLTHLHSLGYVTLQAVNAEEALAIVEAGQDFDLLFTDWIMPGAMNGGKLASESKIRPGVKVLLTSGYAENAIFHHGRHESGILLLAKPYRRSDMARMMRQALAESIGGSADAKAC